MIRRFRQHDRRQVAELTGVWDFAFLGDVEADAVDIASIQYTDRMAVPACFDATPAFAGRRGLVAYRTKVFLCDDTPHRLIFDGVHHWCRVFAGGKQLRDHVGGFTRFAADITGHQPGESEIVALVDNRIDYRRVPLHLDYFDWYHYGGIARSVELHRLGPSWIDALQVRTDDISVPRIRVAIDFGAVADHAQTELVMTWDGRVVLEETVDLAETEGRLERMLDLPGAGLWSPSRPDLHLLHVRLGEDDMRERLGIREVRVAGQQILINGEPVRLLGFCRHDAHPQWGHSQPEGLLVADVQQLRDMGCNFVRGTHYPQDVRFLDLCDEAGICVWSETIGWQHTAEHLTDPHFLQAQLANVDEMVAQSANRPSVIMWGILNESHSEDPACRSAYETLLGRLRELDPTRPATYASNHPFDDQCLDLVDIVSINSYPGWYIGTIADIPTHLDKIFAHLDASGQNDKPIIISEIGAGAIPGWRDWNEARWTEQYQAKLLQAVIRHLFVDRQRVCGLSIWLYNDFRSTELVSRLLGRPRGYNDKGVVDEYRRPKLAYEVVKRHFLELGGKS
ncbi:MAG TPA: glycoside hydrolase family 2 TIM barrel-domain containing protein [Herpetosiphonaceae bacterium]|nr:glycoside hydrolase family 2 TIM barrel-domain containing protein [Herpetosiphonaceae bacterium]